jgi:carbon monoxide dehydrogenase subunit G
VEDLESFKGKRHIGVTLMAIRIEKTFQVQEPLENVWKFLSDPAKVAGCVPGAKITEALDDRTYNGLIKVQVGPSVTDYKGRLRIERLDDQNHEIEITGKGQDVRGKGSASMKMTGKVRSLPDGSTEVASISEVTVVGLLAQLGARMINEVSNKIFAEFTANLSTRLQQARASGGDASTVPSPQEEPRPINAVPLVVAAAAEGVSKLVRQVFKK